MRRFLGAAVLVAALALAVGCGSGGGEEQPTGDVGGGGGAQEGQAPPAAESIRVDIDGDTIDEVIEPTTAAASDLREQLDELVLTEGDVPVGFSSLGGVNLGFDLDFLGLPSAEGGAAQMSMFATPASEDIIVSMVILIEDDTTLQEVFSQIDDLSVEELQDAFDLAGAYADVTLLDTRELDVSGLGDSAYGVALTVEVAQLGVMDSQMVFFGDGPLLAVAMTMAMGGDAAVDVVPLAETMAGKIEAVVQ